MKIRINLSLRRFIFIIIQSDVIILIFNGIGAIKISQMRIREVFCFYSGFKMRVNFFIILFVCLLYQWYIISYSSFLFFVALFLDFLRFFYRWKLYLSQLDFSLYGWIPMVFNTIVSSPWNVLGYNSPFISKLRMCSY